ncbi:thymic stromal cotransporter homolog [Synchiropus splendidus]|uniref:thymic stromal cotransporter homolog n=1 Tax=Synchiropus splendidus TaxID=270530 RepID=UPI00237DBBC1|nr:thymic stromal cotransporter homolog [Synchiropus splendidus]
MRDRHIHWTIHLPVAGVQLGNALFLTALPMIVKQRFTNGSALNSTTSDHDWQTSVSSFYMYYEIFSQLIPIFPGLILAWLGDLGWRKTPIIVPLVGFMLSRLVMLLTLTLEWPLEVVWAEMTVLGISGGFSVFWSSTLTLLTLSSAEQDRSKLMMRLELTSGVSGVVGCVVSGHLFDVTFGGLKPGVLTMAVCLLLYVLCILHVLLVLQTEQPRSCKSLKDLDTRSTCDQRRQMVNILLLWTSGILYTSAVSAAKDILVLFLLMEPLHWSVTQVGYGNALGFLVIVTSFLSITVMSGRFSDLNLITVGMLSYVAGMSCMAFTTTSYMFYIARALTLFSLMPTPIIRSLLSQQVHGSSYGIVLTSLQLSVKATTVISNLLYNQIYQNTLNWFPGLVFIITSIIAVVAIIPIRILVSQLDPDPCPEQGDQKSNDEDLLPLITSCSESLKTIDE